MADYQVTIKPSARQEIDALDDAAFRRIEQKIVLLADNPRPSGCKKLKGHQDIWRIRVGHYRVLYTIDDAEMIVRVSRVAHRRDVYE